MLVREDGLLEGIAPGAWYHAAHAADPVDHGRGLFALDWPLKLMLAVAGAAPVPDDGSMNGPRSVARIAPDRVSPEQREAIERDEAEIARLVVAARARRPEVKPKPPVRAYEVSATRSKAPGRKCPECGSPSPPCGEIRIPKTGDIGARTIVVYECIRCAGEAPTEEKVVLVVKAGVPAGTPAPRELMDDGTGARPAVMLGGHPDGVYADDLSNPPRKMQCRHAGLLLQWDPSALDLQVKAVRVAAFVCVSPGCKKPGITEEVWTY